MTRQTASGIATVSLGAAAVSCAGAVWLTNDLRAFELGLSPAAIFAAALVWHFQRRQARSRVIVDLKRLQDESVDLGSLAE